MEVQAIGKDGALSGSVYVFELNDWIKKDDVKIERSAAAGGGADQGARYRVRVRTGTATGAGTDASVHIALVGSRGT